MRFKASLFWTLMAVQLIILLTVVDPSMASSKCTEIFRSSPASGQSSADQIDSIYAKFIKDFEINLLPKQFSVSSRSLELEAGELQQAQKFGLSKIEYLVIKDYQGWSYYFINYVTVYGSRAEKNDIQPLIEILKSGVSKLPKYSGTVWRYTNLDWPGVPRKNREARQNGTFPLPFGSKAHLNGKSITYPFFVSTFKASQVDVSVNSNVSAMREMKSHHLTMRIKNGFDVSALTHEYYKEDEILILPETSFKVESSSEFILNDLKKRHLHLVEVEN